MDKCKHFNTEFSFPLIDMYHCTKKASREGDFDPKFNIPIPDDDDDEDDEVDPRTLNTRDFDPKFNIPIPGEEEDDD